MLSNSSDPAQIVSGEDELGLKASPPPPPPHHHHPPPCHPCPRRGLTCFTFINIRLRGFPDHLRLVSRVSVEQLVRVLPIGQALPVNRRCSSERRRYQRLFQHDSEGRGARVGWAGQENKNSNLTLEASGRGRRFDESEREREKESARACPPRKRERKREEREKREMREKKETGG